MESVRQAPNPAAHSAKNTCRVGSPTHHMSSSGEDTMVEPTTPDVTFTVSGQVLASVELAYKNYYAALRASVSDFTPARKRAVGAARRALALAYQQLSDEFVEHVELSIALANHACAHLLDRADADDEMAEWFEARAAGGEA